MKYNSPIETFQLSNISLFGKRVRKPESFRKIHLFIFLIVFETFHYKGVFVNEGRISQVISNYLL
jgi:hypothetical protein